MGQSLRLHPLPFLMLALAAFLWLAPSATPDTLHYPEIPAWQGGDCTDAYDPAGVVLPCRARTPWSEADLRARWADEGRPVWTDGDTLTFVYESDAEGVLACCAVQMPMARFEGSDLWVLSVRVPDLAFATVQYGFLPTGATRLEGRGTWRAPGAPVAPPRARALRGTVRTDSLWSEALGEYRGVTVYLPPGHDATRPSPVVYVADGQGIFRVGDDQRAEGLAAYLEPLILAGEVPPTILVGIHSGPARGEEYTSISDATNQVEPENERFLAHERFVLDEVVPWAEQTFGASARREERAVFGFSNGGVWAAFQGIRHPDVFGVAIPFSCGVCSVAVPEEPAPASAGPSARFYFLSGRLETSFHAATSGAEERLRAAGYDTVFRERVAGHDDLMWNEQFVDAVRWAFDALVPAPTE